MNFRAVLFVLGNLLLILAIAMVLPLVGALIINEGNQYEKYEVVTFLQTIIGSIVVGLLFRHRYKSYANSVGVREGFAIVSFAWILLSVVGMLPYLLIGVTDSIVDAFFETMSGFTTTGATIFPKVEVIPAGLQLWRHMTQWLGGMGIVVLSVALLPMLGVGGYRMLKAETPGGVAYERDSAKITDAAKEMWQIYLMFSVTECILLIVAGQTVFDAICHTFTTMSTGGFSPHSESIAFYQSPFVHWIIIVFMFMAGMNFSLHSMIFQGRFKGIFDNSELRLYFLIMVGLTVLGVFQIGGDFGIEERIRVVAFQVVSIGTTTGFATYDYDTWPHLMRFVMVLLMFIGGSMGSTAGGIKVMRFIIFFKSLVRELHRLIFPHAIRPMRIGEKVIAVHVASNIMAFGSLFIGAFLLGVVVMTSYGYDIVTASSASVAALGNIGPGLAKVGPTANWAHLPDMAKIVMSFLMLLGRLELYSVILLFTPWLWKR